MLAFKKCLGFFVFCSGNPTICSRGHDSMTLGTAVSYRNTNRDLYLSIYVVDNYLRYLARQALLLFTVFDFYYMCCRELILSFLPVSRFVPTVFVLICIGYVWYIRLTTKSCRTHKKMYPCYQFCQRRENVKNIIFIHYYLLLFKTLYIFRVSITNVYRSKTFVFCTKNKSFKCLKNAVTMFTNISYLDKNIFFNSK